jgi:squalene-hopene/tetraprenyl-beta-curcumene cyclase
LKGRHPYTDAAPGGWAWTDLSGGVPDADDTAGVLVAMANLCASLEHDAACGAGVPPALLREAHAAAARGLDWLMGVQNRDGGVPTFCRGWGRLPFDRSSPDLTGHAALAMRAWAGRLAASRRFDRFTRRLRAFLERSQSPAGSWTPLWFGNELASDGANPVYGTSRVLLGGAPVGRAGKMPASQNAAVEFLLSQQNDDGGWGACRGVASSIEETAVAVEALCVQRDERLRPAVERGVTWLINRTDGGRVFEPAPIGLYFASLWYYEDIYPVAMTVAALTRAARMR